MADVIVETTEEKEKMVVKDEFAYLKSDDFTSELFKIELRQVPRRIPYSAFIKFLKKLSIKYKKVKLMPAKGGEDASHAYLTLSSEADRTKAIELLNGHHLKGATLVAKLADPSPDPLVKRRRENQEQQDVCHHQEPNVKKAKVEAATFNEDDRFETLSEEEKAAKLNSQVASLWKIPYDQQLAIKHRNLAKVLKKCFFDLLNINRQASGQTIKPAIDWFAQKDNLEPVIASSVVNGYRNKCEFNIDASNTVGFRLGTYKGGSVKVVSPPTTCPILSPTMFEIVSIFQRYLNENTLLKGFDPITREGHWRQMLVRTTRNGGCLISIAFHRQQLTEEEIAKESESIQQFFRKSMNPTDFETKVSLYLQIIQDRSSRLGVVEPQHLSGPSHIYEHLLGVEFRISALSFFQVNAEAAEKLYEKIIEMTLSGKTNSVVLDICCGTGTIGLCLAARKVAKKVVGIELNEDAIKDAEFNREHNGIEAVTFRCGKAEVETSKVLEALEADVEDVVAIIDPPRSGLPTALIKTIRNNIRISRVVYVSCDASMAKQNFMDLCRPRSKAYHGPPFIPKRAVPVDLFPHTEGCELILLFEREQPQKVVVASSKEEISIVAESHQPSEEGTSSSKEIDTPATAAAVVE